MTDMAAQEKHWCQTKSSGLGNAMVVAFSRDGLQRCPWHAVRMKSPRHAYQFGERAGFHRSHDVPAVYLHRELADTQLAAHLLVQKAGHHQRHDFPLATSE